uniref:SHSP domain-containing protein n=1 Tax=Plectus sambesii TaxID=2011161 RepID=A0A914W1G2_9BILA
MDSHTPHPHTPHTPHTPHEVHAPHDVHMPPFSHTHTGPVKTKSEEPTALAKLETLIDHYKLSFDLKFFAGFQSKDCNVEVKERDLIIDCEKHHKHESLDHGFIEVHIIYRLPEDADPASVKMMRDGMKVKVEAERLSYGKPLSMAICDVTPRADDVVVVGGF